MLKDKKLSKKMATIYHWVYKSVEYMTIKHKEWEEGYGSAL